MRYVIKLTVDQIYNNFPDVVKEEEEEEED